MEENNISSTFNNPLYSNAITASNVTDIDPLYQHIQEAYLERGQFLETEIESIIGNIDIKNQYVSAINDILVKVNTAKTSNTNLTLTADEINFINNQLNINISLGGPIGTVTMGILENSLEASRNDLLGSNQRETVLLQHYMTQYNQNYDAMSALMKQLYSLTKDISGRL